MPPEPASDTVVATPSTHKTIVWLASYPKSGNTWLRSLLTAYLEYDQPLDLNALAGAPLQLSRQSLDDHAAISSGEMATEELLPYRGKFHAETARKAHFPLFVKTHSAFDQTLFPPSASAGAIYIVRDPIDIAPSLAHHEGRDIVWAIARMADTKATLNEWQDRTSPVLPERMSSWTENAASWAEQKAIPILLVRYEDMHENPGAAFEKVLRFCGIEPLPARVAAAIEVCDISALRALEERTGFHERPSPDRKFFRSGNVGGGHEELSAAELALIRSSHSSWMKRFGYTTGCQPSQ